MSGSGLAGVPAIYQLYVTFFVPPNKSETELGHREGRTSVPVSSIEQGTRHFVYSETRVNENSYMQDWVATSRLASIEGIYSGRYSIITALSDSVGNKTWLKYYETWGCTDNYWKIVWKEDGNSGWWPSVGEMSRQDGEPHLW